MIDFSRIACGFGRIGKHIANCYERKTMTIEQIAHNAWNRIASCFDILELQNHIERTVYDAVLAERERCAQIAESFIPSGFSGNIGIARDDRARAIAVLIRKDE